MVSRFSTVILGWIAALGYVTLCGIMLAVR